MSRRYYPDIVKIVLHEDWADGLLYCNMEGCAIEEDGVLILLDEDAFYEEGDSDGRY